MDGFVFKDPILTQFNKQEHEGHHKQLAIVFCLESTQSEFSATVIEKLHGRGNREVMAFTIGVIEDMTRHPDIIESS